MRFVWISSTNIAAFWRRCARLWCSVFGLLQAYGINGFDVVSKNISFVCFYWTWNFTFFWQYRKIIAVVILVLRTTMYVCKGALLSISIRRNFIIILISSAPPLFYSPSSPCNSTTHSFMRAKRTRIEKPMCTCSSGILVLNFLFLFAFGLRSTYPTHLFSTTIKHNARTRFPGHFPTFPFHFSLSSPFTLVKTYSFLWQLLVFYFYLYYFVSFWDFFFTSNLIYKFWPLCCIYHCYSLTSNVFFPFSSKLFFFLSASLHCKWVDSPCVNEYREFCFFILFLFFSFVLLLLRFQPVNEIDGILEKFLSIVAYAVEKKVMATSEFNFRYWSVKGEIDGLWIFEVKCQSCRCHWTLKLVIANGIQ